MTDLPDKQAAVDEALLQAAEAGLLMERVGKPLRPYEQDFLDQVFLRAAKEQS